MDDLLYGTHPVREGLQAGRRRPLELFVARGSAERHVEVVELAQRLGVPIRQRERSDLDRLVGMPHHQGLVLRVEPFPYVELDDLIEGWRASGEEAFFLVLDGVTDPHNFGALLRNAEGAGCHGVIVAKDRACPVTGVVDKASAGALEHLQLCQVTNLSRALEQLKEAGVWVYGLADGGDASLFELDLGGHVALVVGSEGKGVRPNTARHCDAVAAIPMQGKVSSLNASVAGGIALFEVVRQRRRSQA